MASYDLNDIFQDWRENQNLDEPDVPDDNKKSNNDAGNDKAEDLTSRDAEDMALQSEIKSATKQPSEPDKEIEAHEKGLDYELGNTKLQDRLSTCLTNALNVKNAQKVILISNRENMRKGLSRDGGLMKNNIAKGQMSTVTIPTQLLRYVQQEIGALSSRTTQNDAVSGFLYWYFGKPEDVTFGADEYDKIQEILDNLDVNASPSRVGKANFNMNNAMLDRLDTLSEQISLMGSLMTTAGRDSSELKVKADKLFIAMCYNILNMTALAPPIQPGERPEDLDLLANGMVWDLMSGVDNAYDYFKTKNGREIYKSRVRKRVDRFAQLAREQAPVMQFGNGNGDALYGGSADASNTGSVSGTHDDASNVNLYMRNDSDADNNNDEVIDLTGGDDYGYGDDADYSDDGFTPDDFESMDGVVIKNEDGLRYDREMMDPMDKLRSFRKK